MPGEDDVRTLIGMLPSNPSQNTNAQTIPGPLDYMKQIGIDAGSMIQNRPVGVAFPMPGPKERPTFERPQVGRTANESKKNSLYSLVGNISNVVQTHNKNEEAKKLRHLQFDLERIMIAMQHPELPQNKQVIDDIMGDPKRRKEIEKALDIKLFDDGKGTYHQNALKGAVSKIKGVLGGGQPQGQQGAPAPQGGAPQGGTAGMPMPGNNILPGERLGIPEALAKRLSMPVGPQLDPRIMMLMELIKGGVIPKADVSLQEGAKTTREREKTAGEIEKTKITAGSRERTAATAAQGRREAATITGQSRERAAKTSAGGRIRAAEISKEASDYRADSSFARTVAKTVIDHQLKMNGAKTNDERAKLIKDQVGTVEKQLSEIDKNIKAIRESTPEEPGIIGRLTSPYQSAKTHLDIQRAQERLQKYVNMKDKLEKQLETLRQDQSKLLEQKDKGGSLGSYASDSNPDDVVDKYVEGLDDDADDTDE